MDMSDGNIDEVGLHLLFIQTLGNKTSYKKSNIFYKLYCLYLYKKSISNIIKYIKNENIYDVLYGLLSIQWSLRDAYYISENSRIDRTKDNNFSAIIIEKDNKKITAIVGPIQYTAFNKRIEANITYIDDESRMAYTINKYSKEDDNPLKKYIEDEIRNIIIEFMKSLIENS